MNKTLRVGVLLLICVLLCAASSPQAEQAVALSVAGLPNLARVSPVLYRSAQPTAEGFSALESKRSLSPGDQPTKTIINLRFLHDDPAVKGIRQYHIPVDTLWPRLGNVRMFLDIVRNKDNHPVLVHCLHGSDRTGLMVAAYRIAVQGWDKESAIAEMVHGGYGFHKAYQHIILFIRQTDFDKLR